MPSTTSRTQTQTTQTKHKSVIDTLYITIYNSGCILVYVKIILIKKQLRSIVSSSSALIFGLTSCGRVSFRCALRKSAALFLIFAELFKILWRVCSSDITCSLFSSRALPGHNVYRLVSVSAIGLSDTAGSESSEHRHSQQQQQGTTPYPKTQPTQQHSAHCTLHRAH